MTGTLEPERRRVLADRYELTALIGAGGAARVYAATDRQLDRTVAVKLLDDSAARSADPAARERFLLESRTAAAFDHPNIVTVYDAGVDGDALFLVMEHVDGQTLGAQLAAHGALPPDCAASIARQVADGLAAAHSQGILHRDVKPANILIDASGRALITDFGIAKRLDEIESSLTTEGMVVGTPAYLAPEQATAGVLTPATDVYALGMVLHEMLTGWRPQGPTAASAWRAAPFDPRERRPDLPAALAEVVLRATAPDPERRFPNAAHVHAALGGRAAMLDQIGQGVAEPASTGPVNSARPATATMHAADPHRATTVLPPGDAAPQATPGRGPVLLLLVAAAVAIAGLVVLADRNGRSSNVTTPTASTTPVATVPAPAAVAPPPTPAVTAPPPPTAPADPEPPGGNGNNGRGNGNNGNGNGNGNGRGRGGG